MIDYGKKLELTEDEKALMGAFAMEMTEEDVVRRLHEAWKRMYVTPKDTEVWTSKVEQSIAAMLSKELDRRGLPSDMRGLEELRKQYGIKPDGLIIMDSMMDSGADRRAINMVLASRVGPSSLTMRMAGAIQTLPREIADKVLVVDEGYGNFNQTLVKAIRETKPETYNEFTNNREGRRAQAAIERRRNKKRGRR